MMGFGFGMGGFGMIIPLIIIVLIVYAFIRFSQGSRNNDVQSTGYDALTILNQRYANGEISEEEYIQKKKMLKN